MAKEELEKYKNLYLKELEQLKEKRKQILILKEKLLLKIGSFDWSKNVSIFTLEKFIDKADWDTLNISDFDNSLRVKPLKGNSKLGVKTFYKGIYL